ncbi:MAG: MOP flippase family protein [Kaistella sp.]
MSIKKRAITGVKWTSVSTVVLAATAILKISILTRFLDKADFGLMALVMFVMGFFNLFNDMGLSSAILHVQNITKKEYASLYWLNIMMNFMMYSILLVCTPLVSGFYNQPELNILIPLLGLNLIITGIGQQFKAIEQKKLLFKQISIIDIISSIISLGLAIGLAVNDYGVYSLVYSALLQYLFSNIAFLILGLKKQGLLFHLRFKETHRFLKIGIYQVGGQVANYFNRDLDILLIGKFFSPSILGGYSLAKQLVFRPAQLINPIIVNVASPTLALYQNDIKALKKNYLHLVNIISSINIPVYIGLIIFAPWIVQILYGNGFEEIVILVRILSVYMILRAIGNPIGSLVIATGRTDLELMWNLLTLIIMPIFIFAGIQYGIVAVAVAVTLVMILLYIPAWKLLVNKLVGASLKEYFIACFKLDYSILKKYIK